MTVGPDREEVGVRIDGAADIRVIPLAVFRELLLFGPGFSAVFAAPQGNFPAGTDYEVDILPMTENSPNACFDDQNMPMLVAARCFDIIDGSVTGSYNRKWEDHRQRLSVLTKATVYSGRFWGMNHQFKFGAIVENERYYRELTQNPFLQRFYAIENEEGSGGEGDLTRTEVYLARLTAPRISDARAFSSSRCM